MRRAQGPARDLAAGKWPESRNAHRIAAFAERLGPAGKDRVHRYWEVLAGLAVQAEQALIDESNGDAELDRNAIEKSFDELARLKRELGPSAFTALKQMLPYSRNDYWEISELRERLDRAPRS